MENIPIFTLHALIIRRILHVFTLSFAQFESAMFVFRATSCIAFWDTHFVEETRKMAYFESLATTINNDTAVFLSAVTMRTSHYAHMSRVFEEAIEYSRGCLVSSAKQIRSKQCFFRLSGAFFLVQWTLKGKRNLL